MNRRPVDGGRAWAYAGAILGGSVSVAANVAHSYVRPDQGWPAGSAGPEPGAVAIAVFWPCALLVAVEILARTSWPGRARWVWLRFGGIVPLALVAAFVSYRHLSGLLDHYGEETVTAYIGPLAVDGLMVLSTSALLATARVKAPAIAAATTEASQGATEGATEVSGPAAVTAPAAGPASTNPLQDAGQDAAAEPDTDTAQDLLAVARAAADELAERKRALNYKNLAPLLRREGHRVGREKTKALIAALHVDTADAA